MIKMSASSKELGSLDRELYEGSVLKPSDAAKQFNVQTPATPTPLYSPQLSKSSLRNLSAIYGGRTDFPHVVYDVKDLALLAKETKHLKTPFTIAYCNLDTGYTFTLGKDPVPGNPELDIGKDKELTPRDRERLAIYDALTMSGNKRLLDAYMKSMSLPHQLRKDIPKIGFSDSDESEYEFEWHQSNGAFSKNGQKRTWKDYLRAAGLSLMLGLAAVTIASHYTIKPVKAQTTTQTHVTVDSPLLKNPVTIDGKYTTLDEWSDASPIKKCVQYSSGEQICGVLKTKHDATTEYTLVEILSKNHFEKDDCINLVFGIKDVRGSVPTPDHLVLIYWIATDVTTPNSTVVSKNALALYGLNKPWPGRVSWDYEVYPKWAAGLYSSPESQNVHQIWEIATPLKGNYSSDPSCNPNNLSSQPFDALFIDLKSNNGLSFTNPSDPNNYYHNPLAYNQNPNLYGDLNYSAIPIAEFQNRIALLALTGLPLFMRKKKKRQNK